MQALITTLSKKIKTRLARGMLIQTLKGSLGNEKKRAGYRRLLMVLVPVYIFIVMVTIHTKHIHMEKPYLPFFSAVEQGIVDLFKRPLQIFPLPPGTGTSILGVTLLGILSMLLLDIYQSIQAHDDPNTVQGDAQWLDALDKFNMEYSEPLGETGHDDINNMIFSKEIFLSKIAGHDMNLNALVIGGSGSGKSFRYVGPNLMMANSSYVVTDPSGSLIRQYGKFLENKGYRVKCLNLNHMELGNHYNPFRYIHSDKDVMMLVSTLISNTTPPDRPPGEAIWENGEKLLLNAIISYIHSYTTESNHNFRNVMRLLRAANVDENDPSNQSALDHIFAAVAMYDPDGIAVKHYENFKKGAGKTLRSFIISCMTRLQAFDLEDVENLTDTDDIDLDSIWDEKTALFISLPTGEGPFNFIASLLYSQLFQRAYDYVENTAGFTQLIIDSEGQVVKSYRAASEEEAEEKRAEAETYLEKIKGGHIKRNKTTRLYEILTEDENLVCFRGSRKEARKAFQSIAEGKVISNKDQTRDGLGQRLPIQLMIMMDEFANIGKVPEFEKKLATCRKYEISISIILQSLTQLQNMYQKNWSELTGNCDTTLYLGGGADSVSQKWISELLGKETRTVMNVSFGRGGGSTSLNRQGVELMSSAQIRTLGKKECIIIPKSMYAYKGEKYPTLEHPNWNAVKKAGPFYWSEESSRHFTEARTSEEPVEEQPKAPVPPSLEEEERRDEKNRENRQRAAEMNKNMDAEGNPVVEEPRPLDGEFAGSGDFGSSPETDIQEAVTTFEKNELIWQQVELVYGSAPAESFSSSA